MLANIIEAHLTSIKKQTPRKILSLNNWTKLVLGRPTSKASERERTEIKDYRSENISSKVCEKFYTWAILSSTAHFQLK